MALSAKTYLFSYISNPDLYGNCCFSCRSKLSCFGVHRQPELTQRDVHEVRFSFIHYNQCTPIACSLVSKPPGFTPDPLAFLRADVAKTRRQVCSEIPAVELAVSSGLCASINGLETSKYSSTLYIRNVLASSRKGRIVLFGVREFAVTNWTASSLAARLLLPES